MPAINNDTISRLIPNPQEFMVRRLISVAVIGCAFLFASGCSGTTEKPDASGTQASTTPSPTPAPAITLVDKATTCAAYNTMMEELGGKVLEIGGRLNQSGMNDATFAAAVSDMQKLWAATQTQLEQQAASAKDAEVKAAITDFAAEAKKAVAAAVAAGGDAEKSRNALNSAALVQAQMKATALCG